MGWLVHRLKSSYDNVISAVDKFLSIGSKQCDTDGKNVWNAKVTVLKNKPH